MIICVIPAVIAAVATVVGSIVAAVASSESNRKTNEANKDLADQAFEQNKALNEQTHQQNLELWKYQNEYNAPSAQMERLRAAGLNPQLVYGSGNVAGNTTSNVPQLDAAKKLAPMMRAFTGFDLGLDDAASVFFNAKLAQSQARLADANALKALADTDVSKANKESIFANTSFTRWREKKDRDLFSLESRTKEAVLSKIYADTKQSDSATDVNKAKLSLMSLEGDFLKRKMKMTDTQIEQIVWSTMKLKQDYDFSSWANSMTKLGLDPNSHGFNRVLDWSLAMLFSPDFLKNTLETEGSGVDILHKVLNENVYKPFGSFDSEKQLDEFKEQIKKMIQNGGEHFSKYPLYPPY